MSEFIKVSDRDLVILVRNARAIQENEGSLYEAYWVEQAKHDERLYLTECERRGLDADAYDTTPRED